MPEPEYIKVLKEIFEERKRNNPRYSLRAFARDLRMQAPSLSHILNGHRRLPETRVADVVEILNLTPERRQHFLESYDHEIHFRGVRRGTA